MDSLSFAHRIVIFLFIHVFRCIHFLYTICISRTQRIPPSLSFKRCLRLSHHQRTTHTYVAYNRHSRTRTQHHERRLSAFPFPPFSPCRDNRPPPTPSPVIPSCSGHAEPQTFPAMKGLGPRPFNSNQGASNELDLTLNCYRPHGAKRGQRRVYDEDATRVSNDLIMDERG
jgi:hypothetical protein